MFRLGLVELIVIFLVLLLFFGAHRIPLMVRELKKAFSSFKKGVSGSDQGNRREEDKEQ